MIHHFFLRPAQGVHERRVEPLDVPAQAVKQPGNFLLASVEAIRPALRLAPGETRHGNLATEVIFPLPCVVEAESVLSHQPLDSAIEQGKTGARKDHRHRPAKLRIHRLRLGEIGQLRRAGNVGQGGQEGVLDDGPKESVGREVERALLDPGSQVSECNFVRAIEHKFVRPSGIRLRRGLTDGDAVAFAGAKDHGRVVSDVDLGVILCPDENLRALRQESA